MSMMKQKSVYTMTDRELRLYKWELRRRRERRKRTMMLFLAVCLVAACMFSYHSVTSSANSGEEEIVYKYYTSVIAKRGETVWNLADNYIDYSQYKNKKEYIKEVCSINNLDENATIKVGQKVTFPYYSTEFVK